MFDIYTFNQTTSGWKQVLKTLKTTKFQQLSNRFSGAVSGAVLAICFQDLLSIYSIFFLMSYTLSKIQQKDDTLVSPSICLFFDPQNKSKVFLLEK